MKRRNFIQKTTITGAILPLSNISLANSLDNEQKMNSKTLRPTTITMWEFSWLERRWSGAGYEDWDLALYELKRRGYNTIRMDAFPHLMHYGPEKEHTLLATWNVQVWGSPSINRVKEVKKNFIAFVRKCKEYSIKIGLSSWFRPDAGKTLDKINSPEVLAKIWLSVLDTLKENDLLDTVIYLDACNEFPHHLWASFANADKKWKQWYSDGAMEWMQTTIKILREAYPEIPYTFSFYGEVTEELIEKADLSFFDLLEPHVWMANNNSGEFYQKVGYWFEKVTNEDYQDLALKGEKTYRENENYWKEGLLKQIEVSAKWSEKYKIPLVTTECWGPIDYKDWPLLEWDWVMELCEFGTTEASKTGRWLSIATSNFCGPQFVGMWREKDWHKRLTEIIKNGPIAEDIKNSKMAKRLV